MSYRVVRLQWGPALKAGRNRTVESAVERVATASMGPGPKGREELRPRCSIPAAAACFNGARP